MTKQPRWLTETKELTCFPRGLDWSETIASLLWNTKMAAMALKSSIQPTNKLT